MQNNSNPQYTNDNRKKRNQRNLLFTILVAAAVAVVAGGILLLMTLMDRSGDVQLPGTTSSSTGGVPAEQTSSLTVSTESTEESSSAASNASAESNTSSSTSDIILEGTKTPITQSADRLLVVVNNETSLPDSYQTSLIKVDEVQLDKAMQSDLNAMIDDAYDAERYLWVTYGYRSEKDQNTIYNERVKELQAEGKSKAEAQKIADKTVQKGGASEYVTGLSVGFNTGDGDFADTDEYQWLIENGAKYGFVLRYPEDKEKITGVAYQPWRFRYVGKKNAMKMQAQNVCLEEYVSSLNNSSNQSGAADVGGTTSSNS